MIETTTTMFAPVATWAAYRSAGTEADYNAMLENGSSTHDRLWRPYDTDEPHRAVVLLLDARTASTVAVEHAVRASNGLHARLHAVLALPRGSATAHPSLIASHVSGLLEASAPRFGFELEVVRRSLDELRAPLEDTTVVTVLVVMDARVGSKLVCSVADRFRVPVLAARDARRDGEWIAASDMQRPLFPVLSAAHHLGRALDREVIYFHNARPTPVFVADPMAGPTSYLEMLQLQDDAVAARRARLHALAERDPRVDCVVARAASTVDAVLDFARDRDADVIVIGHQRRNWFQRMLGRRTSEQIVDQSRRSVLIVPLSS